MQTQIRNCTYSATRVADPGSALFIKAGSGFALY
jgi:hypothetical protein